MKKSFFIGLLFIMTVVGIAFYVDLSKQHQYNITSTSTVIRHPSTDQAITVLSVDNEYGEAFNEKDYLSGGVSVLLVETTKTPGAVSYQTFRNVDEYLRYDINHDHKIDGNDPIFNSLSLLFYDVNTHIRKIVSLKNRGVRAIVFDPNLESKVQHHDALLPNEYLGEMIMGDGSRLPVNFMTVSSKYVLIQ